MADDSSVDSKRDRGALRSLGRYLFDRLIKPVLALHDSPHSLALGVTMGLWVSLTPTVGIQMPIVIVLGTLLGANRLAAIAMCWISNPITFVPMYFAYYKVGLFLLGREGKSYSVIEANITAAADLGSWDLITYLFRVFGAPLWVGSLVLATLIAPPFYPVARRFFTRRQAGRQEREQRQESQVKPRPSAVKGDN